MRGMTTAVLAAVAMLGLTACSSGGTGSTGTQTPTSSSAPAPLAAATFAPPAASGAQPPGVVHNTELVPAGAAATVTAGAAGGGTTVTLAVTGLRPNRKYGSHVHTKVCGPKPLDSGPHYQDKLDPVQPSVDPAFANPKNEVWLDLETDASGAGKASATVAWKWRPNEANSVVLHIDHTNHHDPGKAGTAGERLACLTTPFK
ncbi:superoxide dismutase [Crossiella sp. CA198]|uniref:superoxide dismutase n=1 Tax=Crossiella sp. CA198 TaxID=3455607 RepID=UPI003F8D1BED